MKSKLKFIIPLALVLVGGVYKFALAKPPVGPEPKIAGEIYVMPKDFLLNLADGKFAKLGVALVFRHGFASAPAAGHAAPVAPPEGYGVLAQEAVVRDIVTDVVTNAKARDLTTRVGREKLKGRILKRVHTSTDVEAEEILLTDIAVQ
ncbi:MAG: flagellar basal body-associated FliL family protein [Solirubrobacterales bacterium]|nr:flagellar basal body-associated FliL family protein [Solirubrobacterales bacterium]